MCDRVDSRWGIVGVALLVLLQISGCATRTPAEERSRRAAQRQGDVQIAVVWPWEAKREILWAEGLQMALDEANAAGGVLGRPIRIVRYDDKESVDEGRLIAQRIGADPDVVAVIGHLQSYVSVPAAAIYDLSGLVMIAPVATDPELTAHGYKRVFRTTLTDPEIGRQLADFAAKRGYRRIGIYYIRDAYGRGLANAFEEAVSADGVRIVGRQSYDPSERVTERTFEPLLREWKQLDLDAIFLAGEVPSGALFVAKARELGIRVPILGGDAMSSRALLRIAGPAAEGTFVASFFHPDEHRPAVELFAAAFEKRFGVSPDVGAALAYDAVWLLVRAMKAAGSYAPEDVARLLHHLRDQSGVTGVFRFDERGDTMGRRLVMMEVRGGRFRYLPEQPGVEMEAAASLPFQKRPREKQRDGAPEGRSR